MGVKAVVVFTFFLFRLKIFCGETLIAGFWFFTGIFAKTRFGMYIKQINIDN